MHFFLILDKMKEINDEFLPFTDYREKFMANGDPYCIVAGAKGSFKGPYAPILIQEVTNAMTSGGHMDEINDGIHIHPALTELIPTIMNGLEEA